MVRRLRALCCKHDLLVKVHDLPGKIDHTQAQLRCTSMARPNPRIRSRAVTRWASMASQQLALSEKSHHKSQSGAPRKEDAPLHFVELRLQSIWVALFTAKARSCLPFLLNFSITGLSSAKYQGYQRVRVCELSDEVSRRDKKKNYAAASCRIVLFLMRPTTSIRVPGVSAAMRTIAIGNHRHCSLASLADAETFPQSLPLLAPAPRPSTA